MTNLTIDKEFRDLIPPLSDEEASALEISLKAEGCRDALIVWNNILIDGHNRHKICTAHKIPFKTTDREFIDRDDAKLWIIDNQLGRRNLTPFVRTELHLKKKAILAAEARKKVVEVGKQTGGLKGNGKGAAGRVQQTFAKPLDTRKEIAKAANVAGDTVARVEKIIAKAAAPVLDKLRKGEVSINEAYTTIKYAEKEAAREERREENREIIKKAETPAAIVGKAKFSTIVIDPPWDWGDEGDVNQLGRAKPSYTEFSEFMLERYKLAKVHISSMVRLLAELTAEAPSEWMMTSPRAFSIPVG
jgi:hypothetical protein